MTGKLADLRPAVQAFADFVAETRPGWDRAAFEAALTAAALNRPADREPGQHWAATVVTASRLLADPEATPRNLLAAVRNPLRPVTAVSTPEGRAAVVAQARRLAAEAQEARARAGGGAG